MYVNINIANTGSKRGDMFTNTLLSLAFRSFMGAKFGRIGETL